MAAGAAFRRFDAPVSNQLRGLGGVGRPPLSIEEAAASHVQHLRRLQPNGPYQLVGNCFGSWVAIEMARQLLAAGEQVAALLLVDPDLPASRRSAGRRRRVRERALWMAWQLGLLRRGPLAFYGKISYGLYMFHISVFIYFGWFDLKMDRYGVAGNLAVVAFRLAASTACAAALWYGFESRILKLKKYF